MGKRVNSAAENSVQALHEQRSYGIDLLRIVAVVYVVILHTLGAGGILNAAPVGSPQYQTAWFMETWAYCAVDIFALISGYVSYTGRERKVKCSKYVMLWLQVVAYGAAVTLIFNCFHPELVTKRDLITRLFPVTHSAYWYLNAYTGLFLVMPLLDAGIQKCPAQLLKKVFVVLILAFSFYEVITKRLSMAAGYSFPWLMILYLLGAAIKKCDIGKRLTFVQAVAGALSLTLLAWLWKIYGREFGFSIVWISKDAFISYISPMVLGSAILHVIAFSKLKVGEGFRKLIAIAAPCAFAAYILNCHQIIWKHLMTGNFVSLASRPVPVMVFWVLVFSCAFVVISVLIDRVRIFFFEVFRVGKIVDFFVNAGEKFVTAIAERL